MIHPSFAQVGSRADPSYPHLPHVGLDSFTVDRKPFPTQHHMDTPRSVEWVLQVDLIDPSLDRQLLDRGSHRFVVEAASIEIEQAGLLKDRKLGAFPFNEINSFSPAQHADHIFFSTRRVGS